MFDRRAPEDGVPACSQVDTLDVASGWVLWERGAVLDHKGNVALHDNRGRGRVRGELHERRAGASAGGATLAIATGRAEVDHRTGRVELVELLRRPERAEVVAPAIGHEQELTVEREPESTLQAGRLYHGGAAIRREGQDIPWRAAVARGSDANVELTIGALRDRAN